jgi:hypothetical protein
MGNFTTMDGKFYSPFVCHYDLGFSKAKYIYLVPPMTIIFHLVFEEEGGAIQRRKAVKLAWFFPRQFFCLTYVYYTNPNFCSSQVLKEKHTSYILIHLVCL